MEVMEDAVLNRMRTILQVYKYTLRGSTGKELDWSELAGLIELHYMNVTKRYVELLQNALESFVIGRPHRNPEMKRNGIRHFTTPVGERLEAIILFLTDASNENRYAFCTKKELFETATKHAPVFLLNFLNFEGPPSSHLKAENLRGAFQSDVLNGIETTIDFIGASENGHLIVDVTKVFSNGGKRQRYIGWGVIAPDETIHIYVQNTKTLKNLCYLIIGFDKSFYTGKRGCTLILQEHDYPLDMEENTGSQHEKLLNTHAQLLDKIIVVSRI